MFFYIVESPHACMITLSRINYGGNEMFQYTKQVAYSVAEEKTYNHEFSAFANIDNLSQKILITNDDIDYSTSVVKHIKLKDFLLMQSLEN